MRGQFTDDRSADRLVKRLCVRFLAGVCVLSLALATLQFVVENLLGDATPAATAFRTGVLELATNLATAAGAIGLAVALVLALTLLCTAQAQH